MKTEKVRVQAVVSQELADRIDYYCKMYGTNRSAFIAMKMGEIVSALDRTYAATDNMLVSFREELRGALSSLAEIAPARGDE